MGWQKLKKSRYQKSEDGQLSPFHIRPVGVSEMMRQMNENLIVKANKS